MCFWLEPPLKPSRKGRKHRKGKERSRGKTSEKTAGRRRKEEHETEQETEKREEKTKKERSSRTSERTASTPGPKPAARLDDRHKDHRASVPRSLGHDGTAETLRPKHGHRHREDSRHSGRSGRTGSTAATDDSATLRDEHEHEHEHEPAVADALSQSEDAAFLLLQRLDTSFQAVTAAVNGLDARLTKAQDTVGEAEAEAAAQLLEKSRLVQAQLDDEKRRRRQAQLDARAKSVRAAEKAALRLAREKERGAKAHTRVLDGLSLLVGEITRVVGEREQRKSSEEERQGYARGRRTTPAPSRLDSYANREPRTQGGGSGLFASRFGTPSAAMRSESDVHEEDLDMPGKFPIFWH